jgi:hypothetical protein
MRMPILKLNERFLQLFILGSILILGSLSSKAQTTGEDDNDEFFNEMDRESFKSDLGNDNNQRSIDYSNNGRERGSERSSNYDIFGSGNQTPVYKFEEEQPSSNYSNNNNGGMMIQGGGSMSNGQEFKQPGNTNTPSVGDPFRQSQTGVKNPRNIDAVPDNGDEPNDVPLDGGISILGLAAVAYGFRKFKTKN